MHPILDPKLQGRVVVVVELKELEESLEHRLAVGVLLGDDGGNGGLKTNFLFNNKEKLEKNQTNYIVLIFLI